MKRTVPLFITAISGFVLIVSFFIPAGESLGETVAVWFDIMAAIAFILGGGNLLKMNLKKVSDQSPGWGYAMITVVAFLAMLAVGLLKLGVGPATQQEKYGESFAPLAVAQLPDALVFTQQGAIPAHEEPVPALAREQLSQQGGEIRFHGWMLPGQKADLIAYDEHLEWRCNVEQLYEKAQPPAGLKGKVRYYPDHHALSWAGPMSVEQRDQLLEMSSQIPWQDAVEKLHKASNVLTSVPATVPSHATTSPHGMFGTIGYDDAKRELSIAGPMSTSQRDALKSLFPKIRPFDEDARQALLDAITNRGPLNEEQSKTFDAFIVGVWTPQSLRQAINLAGEPKEAEKSFCELRAEQQAGVAVLKPTKTVGDENELNDSQADAIQAFAYDRKIKVSDLVDTLRRNGELTEDQAAAAQGFMSSLPSAGTVYRQLAIALRQHGPLTGEQMDYLLEDSRREFVWGRQVDALFANAHVVKYPWSGPYSTSGAPFWWLYEYAFKPLTATMFAILAFYVASAAFRAFRAKNAEAVMLLGTAFIILLGRTIAGPYLTAFLPEDSPFAFLKIENLTFSIMSIFNTAGNRAIMIGIALGIASTSLKVLLGIDRSYLGSNED